MTKLFYIAITVLFIISLLLLQTQRDGLHPNMFIWLVVIVPSILLMVYAKGVIGLTELPKRNK